MNEHDLEHNLAALATSTKALKEAVDRIEAFSKDIEHIKRSLWRIEGALFGPDYCFRQDKPEKKSDKIEDF